MRLGVVSDIHANRPALDAVLDAMPAVDSVVCVGDVVGYNPYPADCLDRIRAAGWPTVQGNHDRTVETPERYHNEMAHAGLTLAHDRLDDDQRGWLRRLPESRVVADGRVRLVHSHPARQDAYVYPEEFASLAPHLGSERVLLLGHTHVPGSAWVEGTLVVNPGSVGQPRDGDPRAAFAVVDLDGPEGPTVDHHRVEYDIEAVQTAIRMEGLPERTARRLERGE